MNPKNKRLLAVLAVILALGLGGLALAAFNSDPTSEEILTRVVETLDAAQDGYAIVRVEAETPDKSGWAVVKVWGKKVPDADPEATAVAGLLTVPPKFRIEVREASESEAQGAVAVSDGEQLWLYVPARNTVKTGTVEEMHQHEGDAAYPPFETPEELIQWIMEVSEVTLLGTEEVAGHVAYKLEFVPRPEELPEATATGVTGTAWVDRERWLPLQASFDGGEIGRGQVTVKQVELDVGLSDDLFSFQVPDGAEVVPVEKQELQHLTLEEARAAVDFALLMPAELPEGATLVDVMKVSETVVLRYESAAGPFAISQGTDTEAMKSPSTSGEPVTLRGTTGTLFFTNRAGTKVFLVWSEDGRAFTVSGAISVDEALRVAESLR